MIATEIKKLSPDASQPADQAVLADAAELLRGGELIAFPTETVYGLGALASDSRAVARLYQMKGRPAFNPLIAHIADAGAAFQLGKPTRLAERLADAFWSGPLTLVLEKQAACPVSQLATAGLDSIALRVPANALARQLLARTGAPIVAPSANPSGQLSPSTASHVAAGLGGALRLILDGGPCEKGLESTIIDARSDRPVILRPGPVTAEMLADLGMPPLPSPRPPAGQTEPDQPLAPGQLASHYAPTKPLRLNARTRQPGEWLIGFGTLAPDCDANLSESGDLTEAAARLFDLLHAADTADCEGIAITPIPQDGLGAAINDRLQRAAAPKA